MDKYFDTNRELWNNWTRFHVKSKMYDVEGFKAGQNRLDRIVREGVGEVAGKSILHLQCHFGLDTLSWARLGARVTGVDFSDEAIAEARTLASEVGLDANFVHANIYDLPQHLNDKFDIVFTSYGTIYWLPDLQKWAEVIAHFLVPGGLFYIADGHPTAYIFDNDDKVTDLRVAYSYFHSAEPLRFETVGSYAGEFDYRGVEYGWQHSLSDIVNSLISVSLRIESLNEYPFIVWKEFPFMEQDAEGFWRLPDRFPSIPLMFAIQARKAL